MKSQACKNIKKCDKVLVIAGNCKGQTGNVIRIIGDKVVVQGLNIRKKHVKKQGQQPGRIVELEAPIHRSNVKLCTNEGQPIKLRRRITENDAKELYYLKDGQPVVYRTL